jgi:hypothetical protein
MDTLEKGGAAIDRLKNCLDELETYDGDCDGEAGYWTGVLQAQRRDVVEELAAIAPWLTLSAAPEQYQHLLPKQIPSLKEIAEMEAPSDEDAAGVAERKWLREFRKCIGTANRVARERLDSIAAMMRQCEDIADIDYSFLYNKSEQLLSIGYQVEDGRPDADYYDVLASEARLATYIGVCQGKLPVKSWFALGRTQVDIGGSRVLLSSGGTLFEYLMPLLVMPVFESTLLDRACKSSVRQQIAHGAEDGIPWGISESCYSKMDASRNYQYKVFGIPALSLKHGYAEEEKVVAPYAAMLALMISPDEAFDNLQRLAEQGMVGRYGFFEAIDYTPSRTASEGSPVIVRSFMAHHQGMSLLSLGYLLLGRPLQKLFFSDPELVSSLELLQEKVPEDAILHPHLGRKARPAEGGGNTFADTWKGISFYRQLAESVIRKGCPSDPVALQYRGLTFFQPAVLVRVSHAAHTEMVAHMIQLHAYWRSMGLPVTLVIWNEDTGCYRDFLQRLIIELITGGIGAEALNRHGGGIFIKIIDTLSEEDHAFLAIATRVVAAEHHHENTRSFVKL